MKKTIVSLSIIATTIVFGSKESYTTEFLTQIMQ